MLDDLEGRMEERGIDTVIVPMHESMHASFRWLSRGAKVTRGYAVKMRGREPILVTYPMEREEALATGLEVRLAHEFTARPDDHEELYANMLRALGSGPNLALFGNVPIHL